MKTAEEIKATIATLRANFEEVNVQMKETKNAMVAETLRNLRTQIERDIQCLEWVLSSD